MYCQSLIIDRVEQNSGVGISGILIPKKKKLVEYIGLYDFSPNNPNSHKSKLYENQWILLYPNDPNCVRINGVGFEQDW